jgi:hypothetical protein
VDRSFELRLRRLERLLAEHATPAADGWARRTGTRASVFLDDAVWQSNIDRVSALTRELRTGEPDGADEIDRVVIRLLLDDCHLTLRHLRLTVEGAAQTMDRCSLLLGEMHQEVRRLVQTLEQESGRAAAQGEEQGPAFR